jgi:hypothetical protein
VPRWDSQEYIVAAWCLHPDFVPQEVIIAIPEFVVEPPLYIREHEIIPSELGALDYLVRVCIVEVQDWRTPSSSLDLHSTDDSDDSNDPNWFDRGIGSHSAPWPRAYFHGGTNNRGAEAGGGPPEPRLGPGHGPTFRGMPHLQVGKMLCPIQTAIQRSAGRKAARSYAPPVLRPRACSVSEFLADQQKQEGTNCQ